MYFVKYGEKYLHDPRVDEYTLIDLTLTCEENTCGYCDFTIYPNHPMFNKLKERDVDNLVEVYDDDVLLFSGFIYELGSEFYQNGNVKCKGELDYLRESIVRPYSTLANGYGDGRQPPTTVNGYFEWLIEQHNKQVNENKRFTTGILQGYNLDSNDYIFRESTKYPTTWTEMNDKLLNELGGFFRIRHENGVRYLDYLSEWSDVNSQILDFGKNLTDYTQTDDSDSIATYVMPLGARMNETAYSYDPGYYKTTDTTMNPMKDYYTLSDNGYTKVSDDLTSFESGVTYYEYFYTYDESNMSLTISGLEDKEYDPDGYWKSDDIIFCKSAVQKYGWIGVVYENTDITTKEQLITKSIAALKEVISPKRTIEIKAIDMHLVNPEIKPIRIGEYVRIRSKPHNIDGYFLCKNIDLDLNSPENSTYTFGTSFDTLTGQQNKRLKLLNDTINHTYDKADKLTEKEKQNALSIDAVRKDAKDAKEAANSAVISVTDEYALSDSSSVTPVEGWSIETPEWEDGKFTWRRVKSEYGDGHSEIGEPALLTGNSGKDGEDATLLRIESSRGTVFKNDSVSTMLSVVIYKGTQRITDNTTMKSTFGSGAYLQWKWQRLDDDSFGLISAGDSRIINDGFGFKLSPEDVDTKVTIMCELMV